MPTGLPPCSECCPDARWCPTPADRRRATGEAAPAAAPCRGGSGRNRSVSIPFGMTLDAVFPHSEDRTSTLGMVGGQSHNVITAAGGLPQPAQPVVRIRPGRGHVPGHDLLEHQQLGAVQVRDDRRAGEVARCGVVQRGEVVQMQHRGRMRRNPLQHPLPATCLVLGERGRERGEDPVRCVRPILVRRMHGHRLGHRVLPSSPRVDRGPEVGRHDGQATEERRRVAEVPWLSERSGDDPRSQAHPLLRGGEIPHYLCRAAAGIEGQAVDDLTRCHPVSIAAA